MSDRAVKLLIGRDADAYNAYCDRQRRRYDEDEEREYERCEFCHGLRSVIDLSWQADGSPGTDDFIPCPAGTEFHGLTSQPCEECGGRGEVVVRT